MRYDTYSVGAFLVNELKIAGAVDKILHDGRDIIQIQLITGESLLIYLIDSEIEDYEIRNIFTENTANGDYTLFIIWADLLLPADGRIVDIDNWQYYLLEAYHGCIYAYKTYMQELFIFPVHFERVKLRYKVSYGQTLDVGSICPKHVNTEFAGVWLTASFDGDPDAYHRQRAEQLTPAPLEPYYVLLGLQIGADQAEVKAAFRKLARRYHPDLNPAEDAPRKMQELNIAYEMILKSLD